VFRKDGRLVVDARHMPRWNAIIDATVLTLIFLPALYAVWYRIAPKT
jgi:hypothetical protein